MMLNFKGVYNGTGDSHKPLQNDSATFTQTHKHILVGAQPPPCCSFARDFVGKMVIHFSFAHH